MQETSSPGVACLVWEQATVLSLNRRPWDPERGWQEGGSWFLVGVGRCILFAQPLTWPVRQVTNDCRGNGHCHSFWLVGSIWSSGVIPGNHCWFSVSAKLASRSWAGNRTRREHLARPCNWSSRGSKGVRGSDQRPEGPGMSVSRGASWELWTDIPSVTDSFIPSGHQMPLWGRMVMRVRWGWAVHLQSLNLKWQRKQ